MSGISGDCTVVFPTLETIGFGFGIASISQLLAKLQALPVYSICYGRHLEFSANIASISADCSIVFPTSKNLGVAVGIALFSHFLAKLPVLPFFSSFPAPSWIFH